MRKQKQLNHHRPAEGVYGDCHRTAIACLLDKMPEEVPNFGTHYGDLAAFNKAVDDYLHSVGLAIVSVAFVADDLDTLLQCQQVTNANTYCILGGTSETGVNHSVIALNRKIVWDPSITDAGIIGPCDDGFYWVSWLIPLFMKELSNEN